MHPILLTAMLAPGALAGGACIALRPGNEGFSPGNFGKASGSDSIAPVYTHAWTLPAPSAVISSLHSLATANPSAVSILSGVSLPSGGSYHVVPVPTGGPLSSYITPPDGCTSLTASATGPAATSAYATSGAASTGAASSGAAYSTGEETTAAASTGAASSDAASSGAISSSLAGKVASSVLGSANGTATATGTGAATKTHKSTSVKATTSATSSHSSKATSTSTKPTSTSSKAPTSTKCTSPTARVEWRNMTPAQQTDLVNSIRCLMTTPPRSGQPGVKSRWDDLVAIHQAMAPTIHGVGQFLPYHRQFLWVFEQELRNTCNYKAPLPWWDETKDAGHFQEAPMMTSQLYGSAKDGASQCVTDGGFAGITLDIGPGASDTQHCLARGVNETLSAVVTNNFINTCNSNSDFSTMSQCQYMGVHGYTHDALGGVMSDITSSPNDPLFFLHHAFVDRNYRNWELVDPSSRTYAIGGYTTPECVNGGSGCQETTLNYVLTTLGFYPDVTVAQAVDTQGGHLCYYYDY